MNLYSATTKYLFFSTISRTLDYGIFFELDLKTFEKIINKYSNVKLSDKIIPLDPSTKIILSDKNFNLANVVLKSIIDKFNSKIKIEQNKLEILMIYLDKINYFLSNLLYKNSWNRLHFNKKILSSKNNEKYNDLINKMYVDIQNDQLDFVIIKILILNNVFNDFIEILDIIYSTSNIYVIKMLSILKPNLLDINLKLLKKLFIMEDLMFLKY